MSTVGDSVAGDRSKPAEKQVFPGNSVAWAINLGGAEYSGVDGVDYQADELTLSGEKGRIDRVLGSQDSTIYRTYRTGNMQIRQPISDSVYDITFKFAEPEDIAVGNRVFSIFAENRLVVADLDVRGARDAKHLSALVRSVTGIEVTDGQLDINFEASVGDPILSALVVRRKHPGSRSWELVWGDEFDYEGTPDSGKWHFDVWPPGKVNFEDQAYTDRPENVRVENGMLIIEAHREAYGDAEYTSGRLHSQGEGDFLYGRAEVRARLPAGQGTWSAIWMLPSDPYKYATSCQANEDWQGSSTCDAWPNSGEIDIAEHVGYDMNRVHATVHNKAYYWKNWEQRKASVEGRNVSEDFHKYSIEWTPERIDVFFDDSPYFSYLNESTGWQAWPFDNPYHIILNLAIGGAWGRAGGPIDNSIFPVRMEVDYVRVFKPAKP